MQIANFQWARWNDGVLTINMQPPVDVGGWGIQFSVFHRMGGGAGDNINSGLIMKSIASGIANGASGITVTNSGQGIFQVFIDSNDTSGFPYGNYAAVVSRVGSGVRCVLDEGYLNVTP